MEKMEKSDKVYGYLCETDYRHELGQAPGGVCVYASVQDLLDHCSCAESCGAVKIEFKIVEQVLVGTHDGVMSSDVENKTPKYIEFEKSGIEHYRKKAAYYEQKAKDYLKYAEQSESKLKELLRND